MTVEDLKQKFSVRNVPPHGNCIVVPEKEFKDGWASELKAQGVTVLFQFLPGGPCVVLKVKEQKLEAGEPRVVYEPSKASVGYHKWTDEDDELIVDMWKRNRRASEIRERFKNCTAHAVYQRIGVLKRKGLIGARRKNGQPLEVPKKEEPKLPTVMHTEVYTAVYVDLDKVLTEIRDEVYGMVREHGDFKSLHEGYAVILEELEELWDEVKRPAETRDLRRLRAEALDVASSAAKFALFIQKDLEV